MCLPNWKIENCCVAPGGLTAHLRGVRNGIEDKARGVGTLLPEVTRLVLCHLEAYAVSVRRDAAWVAFAYPVLPSC